MLWAVWQLFHQLKSSLRIASVYTLHVVLSLASRNRLRNRIKLSSAKAIKRNPSRASMISSMTLELPLPWFVRPSAHAAKGAVLGDGMSARSPHIFSQDSSVQRAAGTHSLQSPAFVDPLQLAARQSVTALPRLRRVALYDRVAFSASNASSEIAWREYRHIHHAPRLRASCRLGSRARRCLYAR